MNLKNCMFLLGLIFFNPYLLSQKKEEHNYDQDHHGHDHEHEREVLPPPEFYPKDIFRNPLGIKNLLAGNFGELRNNHFHSGIDIKTNQKEGFNLYSIDNGYVSRINVSPRGYGNAIYIDHPSGYTSVYAHMQKFSDKIEEYVKEKQYEQEKFAVELYPNPDELVLSKGEIIGLSGNSGSSQGPHLHFEIRHTETEEPINPFFFGYDVKDTQAPSIRGLYLYALNGDVAGKKGRYTFPKGTVFKSPIYASGKVGLGVKTYDRHDGAPNNNGTYRIDVVVNKDTIYTWTANRFAFHETRAIHALCDHEALTNHGSWIYQAYVDKGSPLRMYQNLKNDGILELKEGEKYNCELIVSDYAGNSRKATFTLIGKEPPAEKVIDKENRWYWDQPNNFKNDKFEVNFPVGTLYEDMDFDYKYVNGQHHIGDTGVAVHTYFDLAIVPENIPEAKLNKAVIIKKYKSRGRWRTSYEDSGYINGKVIGRSRDFGIFYVGVDDKKPSIKPLHTINGGTFSASKRTLRFSIRDSQTGIEDYDAFIDGKWVRVFYDKKYNRLTLDLEKEDIPKGNHKLELKVWDKKNNLAIYTANFKKI